MESGNEERYNNRQIERMFDEQSKDIKSHIDMGLRPILEQTTKTNGRVTSLEEKDGKHQEWRTALTWSGAVLMFFVIFIILPTLGWALLQLLAIKDGVAADIQTAVQNQFTSEIDHAQANN